MAYASGLWHSLTTSRSRDGLGPKGVFCKRNPIRGNRGQRLRNIRKTTKKHTHHSSVVFRKNSYAKTLAGSDESVVKTPRTKVYFLGKRPVEPRDDLRLRATALPHYLSPKGRLRPQWGVLQTKSDQEQQRAEARKHKKNN